MRTAILSGKQPSKEKERSVSENGDPDGDPKEEHVMNSGLSSSKKEEKRAARKRIRELLRETSEEYRSSASEAICDALMEMDEFRTAGTVFAYNSVGREVSTRSLIGKMLDAGKKVCLPRCTDIDEDGKRKGGAPEMEARYVTSGSRMSEGAYGISEPDDSAEFPLADPSEIDLVILPCLACDRSCNRIGHGAGYYDRFLSELSEDCRTVAFCYEAVLQEELPVEPHDMPVDAVVTEKQVYRWRP